MQCGKWTSTKKPQKNSDKRLNINEEHNGEHAFFQILVNPVLYENLAKML